jgi:glycine cleavage system aminomethyltransferase T
LRALFEGYVAFDHDLRAKLVGPFDISRTEASFQGYIKYHKPFFIGRDALLARDREPSRELVRFRMNQRECADPEQVARWSTNKDR